jgi:hypothetical protein
VLQAFWLNKLLELTSIVEAIKRVLRLKNVDFHRRVLNLIVAATAVTFHACSTYTKIALLGLVSRQYTEQDITTTTFRDQVMQRSQRRDRTGDMSSHFGVTCSNSQVAELGCVTTFASNDLKVVAVDRCEGLSEWEKRKKVEKREEKHRSLPS